MKFKALLYTQITVSLLNVLLAQNLSIANWYNNKQSAVVLSFDDWLPSHANIVVNALQKRDLKATFFVTIQNTKYQPEAFNVMRTAFKNGCEIANHTVTHPDLTSISLQKAQKEILEARKILMDSIPGNPCLSFSFPMGSKNNELIEFIKNYHINARGINSPNENNLHYNFIKQANDYYKIETVRIWRISTTQKISNWVRYAQKGGGLVTFMIHSVVNENNPPGWDPIPQNFLNQLLDTIKSHEKNSWITTLGNATQYHQQKNNTELVLLKNNSKLSVYNVIHNLNTRLFNHDLTLLIDKNKEIEQIKIDKMSTPFYETPTHYQFNIPFNTQKIEIIYKN